MVPLLALSKHLTIPHQRIHRRYHQQQFQRPHQHQSQQQRLTPIKLVLQEENVSMVMAIHCRHHQQQLQRPHQHQSQQQYLTPVKLVLQENLSMIMATGFWALLLVPQLPFWLLLFSRLLLLSFSENGNIWYQICNINTLTIWNIILENLTTYRNS